MPGISASRTTIPFGRKAMSWDSYWATLISATVETAAPTHVVLTFPSAAPALGATDFTITGFTISSASWTGAVFTLVLSEAVLVFNGDLTITFVKSGGTATVTNNVVDDGHTVAWYDVTDISTMTKDTGGTELVEQWRDKLGSGNDVGCADAGYRPLYQSTGIKFLNKWLYSGGFTFDQPEMMYIVFKPVTWIVNRVCFDGTASQTFIYQPGVTPMMVINAGTLLGNIKPVLDTWIILRALFNGESSKMILNNDVAVTGDAGDNNSGGFTMGANRSGGAFSDIEVREVILRKVVDDAGTEAAIYKYLENKHSFFFSPLMNRRIIQDKINAGDTVINSTEIVIISQPLIIPSNRHITINCELKIADAKYANLASDVTANDTVINVVSAADFTVGDFIAISDDILPVQGGVITQTRRVASAGKITDITGNAITIDKPSIYAVSAANGGKIGHCQPVILIDGVTNVTIDGTGIVNGNRYNQFDCEPVQVAFSAMEYGCAIAVLASDYVVINLDAKDSVVCNISFSCANRARHTLIGCEVGNVNLLNAHDKNLCVISTDGIYLHDIDITGGIDAFEDGLIFYMDNKNMRYENITVRDQPRFGICVNANGVSNAVGTSIHVINSVYAIRSSLVVTTDLEIEGTGAFIDISDQYADGNDCIFNNTDIHDIVTAYAVILKGNIENITFNNTSIDGCITPTAAIVATNRADGADYPDNVVFNGGIITDQTGDKTAINASADVTFVNFTNIP